MFRLRAASEDDTICKSKVWLIPSSVLPMKIRPCANRGGSFLVFVFLLWWITNTTWSVNSFHF